MHIVFYVNCTVCSISLLWMFDLAVFGMALHQYHHVRVDSRRAARPTQSLAPGFSVPGKSS